MISLFWSDLRFKTFIFSCQSVPFLWGEKGTCPYIYLFEKIKVFYILIFVYQHSYTEKKKREV